MFLAEPRGSALFGRRQMSIAEIVLWPGTKICQFLGVDPEDDAGLIRSMFNMIVYLVVILGFMWTILG
jgi:hypothetical protein